jgi:hypothetical protein
MIRSVRPGWINNNFEFVWSASDTDALVAVEVAGYKIVSLPKGLLFPARDTQTLERTLRQVLVCSLREAGDTDLAWRVFAFTDDETSSVGHDPTREETERRYADYCTNRPVKKSLGEYQEEEFLIPRIQRR